MGRIDNIEDDIAGIIKRLDSIENFLEFHGYLIGEHDIDQIRQDAQRENSLTKIEQHINTLKNKQNIIIKKLNRK